MPVLVFPNFTVAVLVCLYGGCWLRLGLLFPSSLLYCRNLILDVRGVVVAESGCVRVSPRRVGQESWRNLRGILEAVASDV
jgi:hypothetical protein